MTRKQKHRGRPTPSHPAVAGPEAASEAERIHELIAHGKAKAALELAKEFHKRRNTPETAALVVEAYLARAGALFEQGMMDEGRAMLDLVRQHYVLDPEQRRAMAALLAAQGDWDELVRPLADPALAEETRAAIEATIRKTLTDPGALARSAALPEDHPLRRGTAAVAAALAAVTSRPVSEAETALEEISRRSPLASWKVLARALGAFYRGEDEACARYLETLEPGTPPARLAPVVRALLEGRVAELEQPAAALAQAVSGAQGELRKALEQLDHHFEKLNPRQVLRDIPLAIQACRKERPELLEALRQRISVRAWLEGASPEEIRPALGGPARKDATFWHLMARGAERLSEKTFIACDLWEQFRRHALAEGVLKEGSLAEAALYLHMADLLGHFGAEDFADQRPAYTHSHQGWEAYYTDQPAELRAVGRGTPAQAHDFYFLHPEQLYARACALDPVADNFRRWLAWARQHGERGWKEVEEVALAWHRALPQEAAPLLILVETAEARNALTKALGWLAEAERRDALNPAVRRARLRLWSATLLRHLKQKNARLAAKDLAEIEALPLAGEGDRPAFVAAAHWLLAALEGKAAAAEQARWRAETARRLGGEPAGDCLLRALANACGHATAAKGLPSATLPQAAGVGGLSVPIGRACALGAEMNVPVAIPTAWQKQLIEELKVLSNPAAAPLRALAEAALRNPNLFKVAYAASGAGLAQGAPEEAPRFLLLRARSLSRWQHARRNDALLAAIVLARRQRQMDLAEEALEVWRTEGDGRYYAPWEEDLMQEDLECDPEHVQRVLARERDARDPAKADALELIQGYFPDCPCEDCRAMRGEEAGEMAPRLPRQGRNAPLPQGAGGFHQDDLFGPEEGPASEAQPAAGVDEEDEGPFAEAELGSAMEAMSGLPAEVLQLLMEITLKHMSPGGQLPTFEEIRRRDPGLVRRLDEALDKSDLTLDEVLAALSPEALDELEEDEDFARETGDIFLAPRRRTKSQRRRKRKKDKH